MSYQPLAQSPATATEYEYPPTQSHPELGPPFPLRRPQGRDKRGLVLRYIAAPALLLVLVHFAILGAFPASKYSQWAGPSWTDRQYAMVEAEAEHLLANLDEGSGKPGTFFRDAYPLKSMLAFWELAEKQVAAGGLDTCGGQLGRELIDAYHRSQVAYCVPKGQGEEVHLASAHHSENASLWNQAQTIPATGIWCSPVHRDEFSKWWPYPAAPCVSTNLRAVKGDDKAFRAAGCEKTEDGKALKREMGKERFLGSDLAGVVDELGECAEVIDRTLLVIHRQDQWNP